ncbi:MAG: ankyrin repeat domain-containing protein, partial [Cyanobacteria bacterium P01_C01_bin.121]
MTTEETLIRACIKGDRDLVASLLATGTSPDSRWQSSTGLMWAAMENHPDVVELLLTAGADIDLRNDAGYTALMYAAESDRHNMVADLLDRGADITGCNAYQETVLMMMARHGQTDMVEQLIALGADV